MPITRKATKLPPRQAQNRFDTDIPIPEPDRKGAPSIYHFGEMPIGASFSRPRAQLKRLRSAADSYRRGHPKFNFLVRTVIEGGTEMVRLWRIK
jgi:hypothetical protein